mgnify:FL=1
MIDNSLQTFIEAHNSLHRFLQDNLAAMTLISGQLTSAVAALQATIVLHEKTASDWVTLTRQEYHSLQTEVANHMAEERHSMRAKAIVAGTSGGLVAVIGVVAKLAGAF